MQTENRMSSLFCCTDTQNWPISCIYPAHSQVHFLFSDLRLHFCTLQCTGLKKVKWALNLGRKQDDWRPRVTHELKSEKMRDRHTKRTKDRYCCFVNVLSSSADCGLSVSYRPGAKHTKTSLIPCCRERIRPPPVLVPPVSVSLQSATVSWYHKCKIHNYEQKKVTLTGWVMG